MLTAKEIEEFTMTQEEIDTACENAVEVATTAEVRTVWPRFQTVERAYDIGVVNGNPCIIPLLRVFPGI